MLFNVLSLLVAMLFVHAAILLRRFRGNAQDARDRLLVALSRELHVPQQLQPGDVVDQRALLYANKRNLESQMSRQVDDSTRKAYRVVVEQNEARIQSVERGLPVLEALRRKLVLQDLATGFCVVAIGFTILAYLNHRRMWG
jgi:hypothetical protein